MSAEHRLNAAGIYGKHPGFGDFIAVGLPDDSLKPLGDWMQSVLGEWRGWAGDAWQSLFDHSPRLGFWIGPALLAGDALRGVWAPSRDKAGRRFPLIVAQSGGMAPILEPAPSFYEAAAAALARLHDSEAFEPRTMVERLQAELPAAASESAAWPTFWALNPQLDPASLLTNLQAADHAHASAARSYWWFAGDADRPSGVLACQGWPGLAELGWLIAGGQQTGGAGGGEDVA
ncbi:type VI secretion system-associated protein TagF [Paracoccus saliphilus]|uniref:Type VI secretion system protein ImpM n=1 Tax=Paracoccus saliphilus TaxID=405559 RepID=A0AA45W1I9_9RHOB|nr:type VI secretion system-associated protein TagF [Paracoccus saliphilus]WCR03658.1 type VI secretion system-associated protein TagF [Paracoccus saliphilus]SIS57389.1 type VI secretion system protein ImpM [Paracoccus saliphilus]